MWKLLKPASLSLFILVFFITPVLAMQSENFHIVWDSLNVGGRDDSSSENYSLLDSLGQLVSGPSSSELYEVQAGYRQFEDLIDPILSLVVEAQTDATEVAATAFDGSAGTVTVADASGFAVEDYLAVVENRGLTQRVAVGRITLINGNIITVDSWEGDSAMMAGVEGNQDYCYRTDSREVALGTLTQEFGFTGVSLVEVLTNASNGYTVSVAENHDLRLADGMIAIADVADGEVTAGEEEYGIKVLGTDAAVAGDVAITAVEQTIISAATAPEGVVRGAIIYKASKDLGTAAGQYSHKVIYSLTGSF